MRELYSKVIHKQYAIHWKELGSKLGLQDHVISIISSNNKYNPNATQDCCIAMFEEWLKVIPSPTWGKLNDAIEEIEANKSM